MIPGTEVRQPGPERCATGCRVFVATAVLLLLFGTLLIASGQPAAAAKAVEWARFDVTLTLRNDGSYHVTERQQIDFQGGPFTGGFRDIPLAHVEDIRNIAISEAGSGSTDNYQYEDPSVYTEAPNTYTYQRTSTQIEVKWGFSPTEDASRTFLVDYDVIGGLRVYPNNNPPNEQIWWTAVSSEITNTAPVRESTMQIVLPTAVDTTKVMYSPNGNEKPDQLTHDGKTWTWATTGLNAGDSFTVRLQFPPILNVPAPTWQAADDAQRQHDEEVANRASLYNVIFLGIGLLLAVGGGIGLYGLWYSRGRDPYTGAVADFLPKPPDDLPPGAAGTLLDEVADERDLIATLVDLGRRGVIKIDEVASKGLFGARDFNLTLQASEANLRPFEQTLVNALFKDAKVGATAKMSNVKERFTQSSSQIKDELYDELVKRNYFPRSPEKTREHWKSAAIGIIILVAVGGIILGSVVASTLQAGLVFVPVVVVVGLGLALYFISGKMPKKTAAGAEAAAKWRAFRKYLRSIEKYEKLDEAKHIFDQYLPFAVAFGIEDSWVRKFAEVQTPAPAWYGGGWVGVPMGGGFGRRGYGYGPYGRGGFGPVIIPPPGGFGGGGGQQSGGGGGVDIPSLQDMSNKTAQSLQSGSNSFMDMLNEAAKAFSSWSGGGGGGGWGGGGGGWGGGGSSGGSGGGGGGGFH